MYPLTSIIIPTYNHAEYLPDAIDSALAQSAPVEVIVIDDGSTDDTVAMLTEGIGDRWPADRLRVLLNPHSGPSAARNKGIDHARGEFVMFLDADDVIEPDKVAIQLARFTPEIGWVLSDVRIEDEAAGTAVKASQRYDYAGKELGGWIRPQLEAANFIPIMAPLVRRAVLGDAIRFDDGRIPEDWHFWLAVASAARVRYVPKVLATYRKKRTGRSRLPKASRVIVRNPVAPLRLNLGCGTPNTRSWHPIPGLVNLDKSMGWSFEDGLGEFVDHSVAGITVSHSLMYVAETDWPRVFSEFSRVLKDGGVIRITEDECFNEKSRRVGGWKGSQPAVTLTSPAFVREHLERAGLHAVDVDDQTTRYRDCSLCQAQHGSAPDCFWIEGVKLPGTLFAPHNDDEALFASWTILRYRPRVVICYASSGDYGDSTTREAESREALGILGAQAVEQWDGGDIEARMREFDTKSHPIRVWAPDAATSHREHFEVAQAAARVFGERVTTYHTYNADGKVRSDREVPFEPAWLQHKLRALARYQTQINHPRAHQFFTYDLREYYGTGTA